MKKLPQVFLSIFVLTACTTTTPTNIAEGAQVKLTGKISNTPWQHMIEMPETHPHADYFDFDDGDQIVIYTKDLVDCEGELEVEGEVIKIEGVSKRPDSEEVYTELQLAVDEFECMN